MPEVEIIRFYFMRDGCTFFSTFDQSELDGRCFDTSFIYDGSIPLCVMTANEVTGMWNQRRIPKGSILRWEK